MSKVINLQDYEEKKTRQKIIQQVLKRGNPMSRYRKVVPVQDESSHWYVIPREMQSLFSEMSEDYNRENEFIETFDGYRTGGCLTMVDLYLKEEDLGKL